MLIMIDNYDSFVYNLVRYFNELNEEVLVFRNDEINEDLCNNIFKYLRKYSIKKLTTLSKTYYSLSKKYL